MPPEQNTVLRTPQKSSKVWIVLTVLGAVLSVGLGIALWFALTQQTPQGNQQSTSNQINEQQTQSDTEAITATVRVASPSHVPGTLIEGQTFSFTAPKSWRTLDTTQYAIYKNDLFVDSGNEFLLQFRMASEDAVNNPNNSAFYAENNLELRDVTDWLKASDSTSASVQRQKAFEYVVSQAAENTPKQMTGDNKGMAQLHGNLVSGPFVKAQGVQSADGTLKGVAYLTVGVQAPNYEAMGMVVMGGVINEKKVLLTGMFELHDKQYKAYTGSEDFDTVMKLINAFKEGQVPEDTLGLFKHITDAVASIKITKE